MAQTPPPPPPPAQGPTGYPAGRPRNGMGTAALVLGIVALVLTVLILFAPLGVLLGILAVVFGAVGLARVNQRVADNRGQAVAGLVTGAIALLIGIVLTVSVGTFFSTHVNDFRKFGRCMDDATTDQARRACAEQLSTDLGD
jgi:membrane-bound ClpP family serine protease